MRDYMSIGSSPCEEDCAQVGSSGYGIRAINECERFLKLIREKLGPEPAGARLAVKWFPHDFGSYAEVVCYYEDDDKEAQEYAFKCESDAPMTWNDNKSLKEIEDLRTLHKAERRYDAEEQEQIQDRVI